MSETDKTETIKDAELRAWSDNLLTEHKDRITLNADGTASFKPYFPVAGNAEIKFRRLTVGAVRAAAKIKDRFEAAQFLVATMTGLNASTIDEMDVLDSELCTAIMGKLRTSATGKS